MACLEFVINVFSQFNATKNMLLCMVEAGIAGETKALIPFLPKYNKA